MFRFLQFRRVADGHEADQDVGLAEVADAPGQGGDDADDTRRRRVRCHFQQVRCRRSQSGHDGVAAAKGDHADQGDQDDGQEHHAALDEVGPADGHEAAQEGVDDDDAGTEQEGREVVHAENRFKELAAGDEAR